MRQWTDTTQRPVVSLLTSEMFHLKAPQTFGLLFGVLVLLVAENHSFARRFKSQRLVKDDLGAEELALSLVVNQMALLKIFNESSTICSLGEFPFIVIDPKSG